jgi:hypothetical protein
MSKYTKKHKKQQFRKTKKQRGGINSSKNRKISEKVFTLRQKQKFQHALDEIKVLSKKVKSKSSKQLSASTLTEKKMLDKYNNFCEQELAVISIFLLKEDWRKNYDHLYENPSMPLPLSPLDKVPVATKIGPDKYSNKYLLSKNPSKKTTKFAPTTRVMGGYYDNTIHNDESVKKLINLFNYIVSVTGKKIKIRETVISRFMFILRLSSLRNSQTNWPRLNEAELLAYTNAMILFITNNKSFNVFTLLKLPPELQVIEREYSGLVSRLVIKGIKSEIINTIKLYKGPDEIKLNDLTSTPEIAFGGKIGLVGALSPFHFETINDTYNKPIFCIEKNFTDFLNGLGEQSKSSNQRSQSVLLSVILYVVSKISNFSQPVEGIDETVIYDREGNFIEEKFENKTYTSSDLVRSIQSGEVHMKGDLKNIYKDVCKSDNNDIIPYNALISFNLNPDDTYIHKSFVSSIKPFVKELIYDIFSTLRLNNSGITLPIIFEVGELGVNVINYDRKDLPKSDFKFLQSDNVKKLGNTNYTTAEYKTVDHEIISDSIPEDAYRIINERLVPDISLNGVLVSSICNTVSTMSYLAYLPTYHVATYDFGDANLEYFGAYDPDPDCIKLMNVPQLIINNKILRKLGDEPALDKRLKENYKYSYHRIHVWINKQSKLIYFAIRGTHSSRDWQHSDYLVSRGEGHRMDRVDIIDDVLRQVYSDMQGIWQLGNNTAREAYKLIITGHSLGGNLTNITKVLTHKNSLYRFTDTFTNGFPISCQPYYSSGDNSDEHFKILNWAFSQHKGLVLNVEHDGAAELLITKAKDGKISNNLTIFEATRTKKQKPFGVVDFSLHRTVLYMGFTHSLYNFFGKRTWENIMNHHTQQKLLINGDVIDTTNACIGKLIRNVQGHDNGNTITNILSYIKYDDYEGDSDSTISTNNFILTTNFAVNFDCVIPDKVERT